MATVSVVIPNWNGLRFLDTCLRSLLAQTFTDFDVVVVDNGSHDDSCAFLQKNFPSVRVVHFPENRGFSVAVNAGIHASTGTYVFVLNNDTELAPSCLAALVKGIEGDPTIGAVGPKILEFSDRTTLGGIGDGYTFLGVPYNIGFLERDEGQWNQSMEIFSLSGCAVLYRRAILDAVGVFDEDFFAYCEDVDLGFRLRLARSCCMYIPQAILYHIGSGTTGGRLNPFVRRLITQNMINLMVKNLPGRLFIQVFPFWLLLQTVVLTRILLFSGNARYAQFTAYCQGVHGALQLFPRMLTKRRLIQRQRQLTVPELGRDLRRSERMVLDSLLRRRGKDWVWAPLVRFYLHSVSRSLW